MRKKELIDERFLILLGTDNRFENKDMKKIILGKFGNYKTRVNNEEVEKIGYRIYKLRVNKGVNINFYYELLMSDDFSDTDFKEVNIENFKKELLDKKQYVEKWVFNQSCNGLQEYINKNFEK